MDGTPLTRLDPHRETLREHAAKGWSYARMAIAIGVAPAAFVRYRQQYPDFAAEIDALLESSADGLLDAIRERYINQGEGFDPACARVSLDALKLYLEKRFPKRYGAQVQVRVDHTVDIGPVLARARARLMGQVIDGKVLSSALSTDGLSVVTAPALSALLE